MSEEVIAHLVFVYYPTSCLLVFAFVETLIFDYLIDGYVLEACRSR